jgi:hypothetical protein
MAWSKQCAGTAEMPHDAIGYEGKACPLCDEESSHRECHELETKYLSALMQIEGLLKVALGPTEKNLP